MGQQKGISSLVVTGAANVGMVERQLADVGRSRRRPAVETVLEDRIDTAVGAGAELQTTLARGFEPAGAVLPGEPQNAQTGSEPSLRMRSAFESSAPGHARQSDGHYYSAPYRLLKEQVEVRITQRTVELFHKGERVACHVRSDIRGRHTTLPEHMPSAHRRYAGWTIDRIRRDAAVIGPDTAKLTALIPISTW